MTENARQAIEAVIEEQIAAWCSGDAAAFSRRITGDAVFTNIFGQQFLGREPFERQHAFIFSTIYKGSTMSQTLTHLRFPTPTVAIVHTDTRLSGVRFLPPGYNSPDGAIRSRLLQIMELRDGQWMVTTFHNILDNPPPAHARQ